MQTILITGASRGIGKSTAEVFLKNGWEVLGTSTSGKIALESPNFKAYQLDLRDSESIKSFVELLTKEGKNLDVLFNNAGVSTLSDNEVSGKSLEVEILRKNLEVNLIGLIDLTERILPLVKEGGKVLNMSSMMSSLVSNTGNDYPAYRISKTALNMYTKTLSERLSTQSIAVASFDPGWVKTDMGGADADREPEIPAQELYDLVTKDDLESGNFWFAGEKRSW